MSALAPATLNTTIVVALLLSLASAKPAWATGDTAEIGRVEVVGVATTSRLGNGTVYVLDANDLSARGISTLDQALALVPGLNVRTGAEGVPRIDIRGLRTRQIRVLIDGVPVNAASDGQFDPTTIPVALIEKIIVRTGAASVLYGEGGLAGTIEIVTRKPAGPLAGSTWLQGGTGGAVLGGLQLARAGDTASFALGFESARRDGLPLSSDLAPSPVQPSGLRLNSDAQRDNISARLAWAPQDDLALSLQVLGSRGDRGSPPSLIDSTTDVYAQRPRYDRTENQHSASAQLSVQWTPNAATVVRSWVYTAMEDANERRYDDANLNLLVSRTVRGGFDLSGDSRVDGMHLQGSLALSPSFGISMAADTRREDYRQSGRIRDVAAAGGGSGGGGGGGGGSGGGAAGNFNIRNVNERHQTHVDSLASELGWRAGRDTQLGLGLGLVRQRREGEDRSAGILSLDARQALNDTLSAKASWARRVRAPSIAQLHDATSGNPDLRLERIDAAEAGLDWRGQGRGAQLTIFRNQVRDLIRNDDVTGRAANIDRVRFNGVEVQGHLQLLSSLLLNSGYTQLRSHNQSPGTVFETLAYSPRHKLTLEARWQAAGALELGAQMLHVRGQVYDSRTGTPQQASLPDYTLLGLNINWRLELLMLGLRVDNALDKAYGTSYGFSQPGRSVSLRAEARF